MPEARRRVLVFNHFAAPLGQAGGTRHVELFRRLEGWEHLIIASDLNPQSGQRIVDEPGFCVVSVPPYASNGLRRILNWVAYAWGALRLGLQQRSVDIVYASTPHLLAGLTGWATAAAKRVPFILEVRDLWPRVLVEMGELAETSPIFRVLTGLENFLYARANAIVVLAEGSRTALLGRGIPQSKIHLVPNGADTADFVPSAGREELRKRYGFTKFTAVYAGAHGPANGLELVLDAAQHLRDEPVEIALVGGGVSKAGLIEEARRRRLTNVRFLDPVPKDEIPDLLAAADAGLHVLADVELFRTAVSPNKIFDYMAAGLPVVTNSPGLVSDIVLDANAGLAVAPDEIGPGLTALAQAAPDANSKRGSDGRLWLEKHQSRTAMVVRLQRVLESVHRSRGPS